MSRRLAVVGVLLLVIVVVGFAISAITKARFNANLAASRNNLRQLAQFAAHTETNPKQAGTRTATEVPPGTVVLVGVPPEDRLSWVGYVLPGLDQKRQDIAKLFAQIDDTQPWANERNQGAARTRLIVMLCPENTPQPAPDAPAITCYVAIAGLGTDAATLALPATGSAPPRAGAFRYDAATPFDRITDGLGQTLLMGETADAPGPWLRGGFSTVRGLDDTTGAKPLILAGAGGQFGGYFPNGANFAMCDGSVQTFSPRVTPAVLLKLATIADGKDGVVLD